MAFKNEEQRITPLYANQRRRVVQRNAVWILALTVLCCATHSFMLHKQCSQLEKEVQKLKESRDIVIQELVTVSLKNAQEKQARATQAQAYAAVGAWEYIGECRITAYCCEPYAHVCGTGDGLTATGIPVTPGIAAVDPAVIPLGSTLVIDGQRYLAADIGESVVGKSVDISVATHQEAIDFGVQAADVWVVVF